MLHEESGSLAQIEEDKDHHLGPLHDFQNKKKSLHVLQVNKCVSRLMTFGKMTHTGNAATCKQSQATGFGRRKDKPRG